MTTATTTGSMDSKKIIEFPIEQLQPNPTQPRGIISPESIMELADSIKEHGLLEPLVVAHTPAGYQIVAGERRWRASKMAGLKMVACIIKETSPRGMLEMALVENVQREDLNCLERAKAFKRLKQEFNLGTGEVAKRISKSPAYISNTLRLLELPDAIKDGLLSTLITEGHARALLTIEDPRLIVEAYKMILRESASVRRAEDISRRIRAATGEAIGAGANQGKPQLIVSEAVDKLQDALQQALGKEAKVKLVRTLKQTRLYITLLGGPEKTEDELQRIIKGLAQG
jgi:ParB family chromosome partitioning protein